MQKTIASLLAAFALVACAGTDSTVDQTTGDGVEGLKKSCGGIADIQCPKGYACKITATYPDAMGTCKKKNVCIDNVMCAINSHWDSVLCECVENVSCNVLECMSGYHCEEKGLNGGSTGVCIKN